MIKKVNERKDLLRLYFYKFYRAGLINKFRNIKKRKTCQVRESIKFNNINSERLNSGELDSLEKAKKTKSSKNLSSKELKEKEELKKKLWKFWKKLYLKQIGKI